MQLKTLKLKNFRQYIDEKIDFSTDRERNVTLITGSTGAGKTTIEQAFMYVLYGTYNFQNKELINNEVKSKAKQNEILKSEVSLCFIYKANEYQLTRIQSYQKINESKVLLLQTKIELLLNRDGNFIPQKDELALKIASQMIPRQLAEYFFVDGEIFEDMSKNISDSSKQDDFIKVVKSILGLNYITKAIEHLKSINKSYEKEISKLGGPKILDLMNKIDSTLSDIQRFENNNSNIETEIQNYLKEQDNLDQKMKSIPNAEKLQSEFKKREQDIEKAERDLENYKQSYINLNNMNFIYFIGSPLIRNALNILDNNKIIDYGIPNLHSKTIEHLLSSGTCLCGNDLNLNKDAVKRLEYLKTTVPPYSTGQAISSYVKDSKYKIESIQNVYQTNKNTFKTIRQLMREIESFKSDQTLLSSQMTQIDSIVDMKHRYDFVSSQIQKLKQDIFSNTKEIGKLEDILASLRSEKDSLSIRNDASKKIEAYKEYVETITTRLTRHYENKEEIIRAELEKNINFFIKSMYQEGFKVEIDRKYRINISVEKSVIGDNINKSKGQGFLIIFAFIASVIKMAKEKRSEDEQVEQEYYPLVMDAPISTIDTEYIGKICNTLPDVAEQVIVFLNRKDSEIFYANSLKYIGRMYELEQQDNNLLVTKIKEVNNV
mgnify:CR=1 FL=1